MAGQRGFTLIEMLVALSVFSIAALALLRIDAYAVSTAANLQENGLARLVAANEAALIASDPAAPVRGQSARQVVNGGQSFAVVTDVAPTPDPRFRAVTITVRPLAGGPSRRLVTVKRVDR
ncbi:type II secretion system minor pseudopilin GspI [Sphingomicrobium astaxanthinifaciens]|uniref:type II secretion system minor pseudopilin GspI n=1 Tax=Sphingomicrobium astaxanthinifaciens TaxID=1227949 RepID=UPI001FCBC979|nr:type II secretion system minor pseudopilin GspI [Sphingomicrobium astaxanthinifaciens]MCJ7421075.1 type II secretion system minor pseudopilin GspI [Sphingomicrobium astaxanthinifaciens]